MIIPCLEASGPKLLAPLTVLLVVLPSGCAGTPWGESLSGSFPNPSEKAPPQPGRLQDQGPSALPTPSAPPQALPPSPTPQGLARSPEQKSPSSPLTAQQESTALRPPGAKAQASPARSAPAPKPKVAPSPSATIPYRVTIRLPEADPSAPAEGVTQALRTAGIPFEVETIERVKGTAPAAVPLPEGTQGSGTAPSVRPAPSPR